MDPERARLELALEEREGRLVLVGTREGEAVVRVVDVDAEGGTERRLVIVYGVAVEQAVRVAADHCDVRVDEVLGERAAPRHVQADVQRARRIGVFLATELTTVPREEIRGRFAAEARADVEGAHERIRIEAQQDPELARTLRRLEAELTVLRAYHVLKLEGRAGDRWSTKGGVVMEDGRRVRKKGTRYTVFGYDTVQVMGKPHRALVVSADRMPLRDLYWFAAGVGWVRFRRELEGQVKQDAFLVEFAPGGAN